MLILAPPITASFGFLELRTLLSSKISFCSSKPGSLFVLNKLGIFTIEASFLWQTAKASFIKKSTFLAIFLANKMLDDCSPLLNRRFSRIKISPSFSFFFC